MAQQSHPLKWHSQAISVAKTPLWEIGSTSLCKVSFNRHRTMLLCLSCNSIIQVQPHLLVNMAMFPMELCSPLWNKAIFEPATNTESQMKTSPVFSACFLADVYVGEGSKRNLLRYYFCILYIIYVFYCDL